MKILYLHQYFGTRGGSNGIRSHEMARRMVEKGHSVTMVCASFANSTTGLTGEFTQGRRSGRVDGIDVVEFDLAHSNADGVLARTKKFSAYAMRAIGFALRGDHDLVFATSTPLTAGIPGILAKLLRRKPFVFEVRDLWPELPKAMGMKNPLLLGSMHVLERTSYAAADHVIGLAPGIVEGIARSGKDPERITLIPNACDLDLFDQAPARHPHLDYPDRIGAHDFVALFAGAHGRANGLDALIPVAQILERRGRGDIKFLLIGQGSEKAGLQQRVGQAGLKNIVFADPVPKLQVASLLKGSGMGLQILADVPAFYEGTSPNKFFDYLAAGKPMVINYPGWLARLVQEQGCGLAVPPHRPEVFADAVERLADDPSLRIRSGRAARDLGEARFDRSRLAEQFERVLCEAALRKVSARPETQYK